MTRGLLRTLVVLVAGWLALAASPATARPQHSHGWYDLNDPNVDQASGRLGQVTFSVAVDAGTCLGLGPVCDLEVMIDNASDEPLWVLIPNHTVEGSFKPGHQPAALRVLEAEWRGPESGQPVMVNFFTGSMVLNASNWGGPFAVRVSAGAKVRVRTPLDAPCAILGPCPSFVRLPLAVARDIDFTGAEIFRPPGGPLTWSQPDARLEWLTLAPGYIGEEKLHDAAQHAVPHTVRLVGAQSIWIKLSWDTRSRRHRRR